MWPEPEFISGIVGRDYVEPTKGPGLITAREAEPQKTTNLGFVVIPWGNEKREAEPQKTANLGFHDIPWGNVKRQAEPEATPVVFYPFGNDKREAAPSGLHTSTLKARDDAHLDPRPPPTYGGPGRRDVADD